jgi:hypothetical protein
MDDEDDDGTIIIWTCCRSCNTTSYL